MKPTETVCFSLSLKVFDQNFFVTSCSFISTIHDDDQTPLNSQFQRRSPDDPPSSLSLPCRCLTSQLHFRLLNFFILNRTISIDNFISYSISGFVSFLFPNVFTFASQKGSKKEFSFIRNCFTILIQNPRICEWGKKPTKKKSKRELEFFFARNLHDLVRSRMFCVWDFFDRFNHWCFDLSRKEIFFNYFSGLFFGGMLGMCGICVRKLRTSAVQQWLHAYQTSSLQQRSTQSRCNQIITFDLRPYQRLFKVVIK